MISRKIDSVIAEHFTKSRAALLLSGARQTGKTYAIRKYAQQSGLQLLEMNFLLQPDAKNLFAGAKDVKDLLLRMTAFGSKPMRKGKTLVFFDEVQACPDVLTWVKALVDDGSFQYALSGSLLGIELKNIRSVPVGYMTEYSVFPLDFEEFVRAIGLSTEVLDAVRKAWENLEPIDEYIHSKMMGLFNLYLLVGGMPAVVQAYLDSNDLQRVMHEQRSILNLYKRDIGQYVQHDKLYINEIFELIPPELNAKNKRFILKNLNEHFKFSRYESSFVWLREAGMALPVYNVEEPTVPLKLNEQRNLFKLFQNDVGLLASQYASGIHLQILRGDVQINHGAIYENAVAQELHAHGWKLYYFNSKKQGEVDFLLEKDAEIIPVEVKSGKDFRRHAALNNILSSSAYSIKRGIVLCNDNLSVRGRVVYAPIYMTMFLHYREAEQPLIYKPEV